MNQKLLTLFIGLLVGAFMLKPIGALAQTLVYCAEAGPDYFNPQMSVSGAAFDASNLLYSRLLDWSEDGKTLAPALAKSWSLSKDQKTYTFHLRKNVWFYPREIDKGKNKRKSRGKAKETNREKNRGKFKPSRPLNADDVLFSFQRQRDKNHPFHSVNGGAYKFFYSLNLQNKIQAIKKKGDYTVEFTLEKPLGLFPSLMAMEFAVIHSKEYADFLLQAGQAEKIDFEPVGTGPFILEKYVKGSLIRYKRNENYYDGPAKLEKIVFSITPDPNVRFQKLKTGECHWSAKPQPSDIPLMRKHKNIRVLEGDNYYNISYLAMNTRKPPLNNPNIRKAIAHALNRKLYITAIHFGMADLLNSPVPKGLWGHHSKIRVPEYNPEKAKAILKAEGFEKGFKLKLWTLPISRPYNPNGKKMGELMQADLKKVNIEAQLVTYDWPAYLSKSSAGEHELIQMGWSADIPEPSNFLQILLSCESIAGGSNLSRYCNKGYDRLIKKAMAKAGKQGSPLYQQAQDIFIQDLPFIPLAQARKVIAISKKVKGYRVKPFGSERFYHISLRKD